MKANMNDGGSPVPETQIELEEPLDGSSHVGGRSGLRRSVWERDFHFKGIWFFPGNTLRSGVPVSCLLWSSGGTQEGPDPAHPPDPLPSGSPLGLLTFPQPSNDQRRSL